MNTKGIKVERVFLIIFVFAASLFVGWYGEKAVEKFIASYQVQNL